MNATAPGRELVEVPLPPEAAREVLAFARDSTVSGSVGLTYAKGRGVVGEFVLVPFPQEVAAEVESFVDVAVFGTMQLHFQGGRLLALKVNFVKELPNGLAVQVERNKKIHSGG